jgi:hypothetical protein
VGEQRQLAQRHQLLERIATSLRGTSGSEQLLVSGCHLEAIPNDSSTCAASVEPVVASRALRDMPYRDRIPREEAVATNPTF